MWSEESLAESSSTNTCVLFVPVMFSSHFSLVSYILASFDLFSNIDMFE